MSKRGDGLGKDGHWIGDQVGKAEVVHSEDDDGVEVGVKAGDVGREGGDGLGDGNELSRLCLVRFCHIGRSMFVLLGNVWMDFQNYLRPWRSKDD